MVALLFATLVAITPQDQQKFNDLWDAEQKQRSVLGTVLRDEKSTEAQIREAIAGLHKLIEHCASPEVRNLKGADGLPGLYYQINDILLQVISGYARLKDVPNAVRYAETLATYLKAPDSWLKGKDAMFFSLYARQLKNDTYISKLLPNAKLEAIILDLNSRNPNRVIDSVPFSTEDREKLTADERIAGLSLLWSEAKYNFVNFDLVRTLDWDAAYRTYLPKVGAPQTRYAYYNLLREFMALLKDGHTDVSLPESLAVKEETRPPLPIFRLGDQVVVSVDPSPGFQQLGFRRGDVIRKIDGVDAIEYGRKTWGHRVSCSTPQSKDVFIYTYMLLRGPAKSKVELEVEHADKSVQKISLPRDTKIPGTFLPPYEFKILPDGTAYFVFNTCANDEPSKAFEKHLPEIQKAGRLIIDARRNEGGSSSVGWSIISHLIDKPIPVVQWETRTYRPSFRAWSRPVEAYTGSSSLPPHKDHFAGPVAVLSGPRTFSAGEDFLGAFKVAKRGPLIGMPTGGSTGQPLSFQLPGGGWGRICTKRDRLGDGTEFVGVGVIPDIKIWTNLEALRKNQDPVLEEALRQVNAKK